MNNDEYKYWQETSKKLFEQLNYAFIKWVESSLNQAPKEALNIKSNVYILCSVLTAFDVFIPNVLFAAIKSCGFTKHDAHDLIEKLKLKTLETFDAIYDATSNTKSH
jgi:hypothetical protein